MFQRGKPQYVQSPNSPPSLSPENNHQPPNCLWIPIDVIGKFFINIILYKQMLVMAVRKC